MRTTDVLNLIDNALETIDHPARQYDDDTTRLNDLAHAVTILGRLRGLAERLAAEAEAKQSSLYEHGVGTSTWLARELRLTQSQAMRLVRQGEAQRRFLHVEDAVLDGMIRPEQAAAITKNLTHLPDGLDTPAWDRAERDLIIQAEHFDSAGLATLSLHMLEVAAPDIADNLEEKRLERERQQAERDQYLNFSDDGHVLRFSGALPTVEGLALKTLIDATAEKLRAAEITSHTWNRATDPATRRAQALVWLVDRLNREQVAPGHGGDRPRIVVTMRYEDLLDQARHAHLITGQPVDAGSLRRLLCDAELMPMVFRGQSELLDVGRKERLVTQPLRLALERRDRGCVVPGCDRGPADCQAHHIHPWWAGGPTKLSNLVLLCRHHHALIEPGRYPSPIQLTVTIAADGIPEVARPGRPPQRHQRFRAPARPVDPPRVPLRT